MIEHPELIMMGGESITMNVRNSYETWKIILEYLDDGNWTFGYRRAYPTTSELIPITKCKSIEIEDTITNSGRHCAREFLVNANGKKMWGKDKIHGVNSLDGGKKLIQAYCELNNIPFTYKMFKDGVEIVPTDSD